MSIHTEKSRITARTKGAWAGQDRNRDLWDLSKRELIEVTLHLAACLTGEYDNALKTDMARRRVVQEHESLRANGLI